MITTHLTGHMYRNSPYETDSSCGNCNGARCETCTKIFKVNGFDNKFDSIDNAKRYEESIHALISEWDTHRYFDVDFNRFFIKDKELHVLVSASSTEKCIEIKCNVTNSDTYKEIYKEAEKRRLRYEACVCTDKDSEDEYECCKCVGCTDSSCYYEMIDGKRTKKKWYM